MNAQQHSWKYLGPKPGSHYRQLFVKGTRIAARVLYAYFMPGEDWQGQSVEEVATGFGLPVEAVREAIAYCESNPPEIEEDLQREQALVAATEPRDSKAGRTPTRLSAEDYARIFLR